MLVTGTPAAAQQKGAIIGEILDAVDGSPLIKVTVTIQGTKLKATTDSLGTFRIDGVEAGEVTVRFQKAGYASLAEPVVVHDGWTTGVRFELAPTAVLLDALRVHAGGTPVPVDAAGGKRAEVRPTDSNGPTSMLETIGTSVPGVMVMKPSGEVGRGSRVMIRGPSSISLSNLPLVYLDGIRVQAEQYGVRGRGLLSLDFIDPQSIDRIEVLRGPAAAAQFGGEASAGVIMVYTKRGGGR
jgi:hypothetical protein